MTTADIGMFANAAAMGWLAVLFIVPSASPRWGAFALALALGAAAITLSWWFGGPAGARIATFGVAAGALAATSILCRHAIRQ